MSLRRRNSPGNPAAAILPLVFALAAGAMVHLVAQAPDAARKAQGRSGNPVIEGWYADPDGVVFKDITPANYVEGPFVFKRQGKYYLMWSEGGWQGPNYSVAYAIGDSPAGPFSRVGKVLQQDPGVATGAGHHSVIPVPGSNTWYIVYHRRPLGTKDGNHREVCIDEMHFDPDGTIRPVQISFEGVKARRLHPAR